MRTVSLLHLLLVTGLIVAVPYAEAGPVTGSTLLPAVDNSTNDTTRESQASSQESANGSAALFDAGGLPLLRMSAPIYLQLGTRGKLRGSGLTDNNAAAVSEIFSSADTGSGGGGGGGGAIASVVPPPTIIHNTGPAAIPEPATLLLAVPAVLFGVRRFSRRHANTR